LQPSLLQAEQAQLAQPLRVGEMLLLLFSETVNFHGQREEPSFDLMKIEIQFRGSLNIPVTFIWKWRVGSLWGVTVVAHVMFPCLQIRDLIIGD